MPEPQTFQALGWVCVAIFSLAAGTLAVLKVVEWFRAKPSPQFVADHAARSFVPKEVFNAHVQRDESEHKDIFHRLGGMDRGLRAEMKAESTRIEDKFTNLAREVSEGNTTAELINQRVVQMDNKLDRLIERL